MSDESTPSMAELIMEEAEEADDLLQRVSETKERITDTASSSEIGFLQDACKPQELSVDLESSMAQSGETPPRHVHQPSSSNCVNMTCDPQDPVGDVALYVKQLLQDIVKGRLDLCGNPWVVPKSVFQEARHTNKRRSDKGERALDATETLNLILRPSIFVWAPEKLIPGLRVHCAACGGIASVHGWGDVRTVHSMVGHSLYVCTRHKCGKCSAKSKRKPSRNQARVINKSNKAVMEKKFLADAQEVIEMLPPDLQSLWRFRSTGRIICDMSLTDFIRASATTHSWSTIVNIINEMKETAWAREITLRYLKLCDVLHIVPDAVPIELPSEYRLSADWVRNYFVADFQSRREDVHQEIVATIGDHVLLFDWTVDVASRCGGAAMFNVMSGAGKILASVLTETTKPYEVRPLLWSLRLRGIRPDVIYVDDECCGAWRDLVFQVWPNTVVRLDIMHAITRLARTTSSTQHPWHGEFCKKLSNAIYVYDAEESRRLRQARQRAGLTPDLPTRMLRECVPRVTRTASEIAAGLTDTMKYYKDRVHCRMGALLTPASHAALENLLKHVRNGCLCDPAGIQINMCMHGEQVSMGGETFHKIRTFRGVSPLDGFHHHQKQWLGVGCTHAREAGLALVADGTVRWNRKRDNEASASSERIPYVFATGLLTEIDDIHQRLVGRKCFPNRQLAGEASDLISIGHIDNLMAESGDGPS